MRSLISAVIALSDSGRSMVIRSTPSSVVIWRSSVMGNDPR